MRLVRPVLCSFARAGRRLQAQPGTAFRASGTFCADQTRGSCSSFVTGRKRALTLTPCLANAPTAGPLQAYAKLVLKGEIREDRHQVEALHLLQTVRVIRQSCLALCGDGLQNVEGSLELKLGSLLGREVFNEYREASSWSMDTQQYLYSCNSELNRRRLVLLYSTCTLSRSCMRLWKATGHRFRFVNSISACGRLSSTLWGATMTTAAAAVASRSQLRTPREGFTCTGEWEQGRHL